tara:strand:+ start:25 stop:801 length:777 start_codon:yes stop_codon:yes gene_type:complete
MFDWEVYPNSKISKINSPILRYFALLFRNLKNVPSIFKNIKKLNNEYAKLVNDEYFKNIKLALIYIKSARVNGDIVEFGTHGVTAVIICKLLSHYKSKLSIHMFDSFKGYPKAIAEEDINSPHIKTKVWQEGGAPAPISAAKLNKKLQKMIPSNQIKIYEGWFNETLKNIPEKTNFAMVLMDCNMYASSLAALDYLYSKRMISEGAIILFSDWNVNKASSDFSSRKVWKEMVSKYDIKYSNNGSYSWGGQKFIIHSYN